MNNNLSGPCQYLRLWGSEVFRYTYTGLLLALGLPLNALALWVFCCRLPRWTATHVYMVNLAVADLCLLCTLPTLLFSKYLTPLLCYICQGCYLANRYMSISLIMAISLDRYVGVQHPLWARSLRSPGRALALCLLLWVLVGGSLGLRVILASSTGATCLFDALTQDPQPAIFSLLGFYLPLAVLAFCSLRVGAALAQRPVADPGQVEATHKASRMVWANLAVFVACFLPLHLVLTVYLALGPKQHTCALKSALFVTSKFSDANGCLDAVCYYYSAKEFQEVSVWPMVCSSKAHPNQDSVCVCVALAQVPTSSSQEGECANHPICEHHLQESGNVASVPDFQDLLPPAPSRGSPTRPMVPSASVVRLVAQGTVLLPHVLRVPQPSAICCPDTFDGTIAARELHCAHTPVPEDPVYTPVPKDARHVDSCPGLPRVCGRSVLEAIY
ncbi:G-protein coupled receptor 35 [Suncus etruscus]|uniref:G-protein coupled receptor 35 n=1 Tax=Suncus etruscus TaxID=109475 RepID=UPI0021107708|nr:G-protein coupled receptor 35 [Suncus etruscus]